MPGALLDAKRIVSAHRQPRDARRAQIMERDRTSVVVAGEELCSLHAGQLEVVAQLAREVRLRSADADDGPALLRVVHRMENREELALDGDAPTLSALRRRDRTGLAVRALRDVRHAVLEVDVVPVERPHFASARVEVDGERVGAAHCAGDFLARDEREELRRVEVLFCFLLSAVGAFDVVARVVGAHAKIGTLRLARVAEHLGDEPPRIDRSLPRELVGANGRIEMADDVLEIGAAHVRDLRGADAREHPLRQTTAIGGDRREALLFTSIEPAIDVLVHRLRARLRYDATGLHLDRDGARDATSAIDVVLLDAREVHGAPLVDALRALSGRRRERDARFPALTLHAPLR